MNGSDKWRTYSIVALNAGQLGLGSSLPGHPGLIVDSLLFSIKGASRITENHSFTENHLENHIYRGIIPS